MATDDSSSDARSAMVADATNSAIYRRSESQVANESIVARQRLGQAQLKAGVAETAAEVRNLGAEAGVLRAQLSDLDARLRHLGI